MVFPPAYPQVAGGDEDSGSAAAEGVGHPGGVRAPQQVPLLVRPLAGLHRGGLPGAVIEGLKFEVSR